MLFFQGEGTQEPWSAAEDGGCVIRGPPLPEGLHQRGGLHRGPHRGPQVRRRDACQGYRGQAAVHEDITAAVPVLWEQIPRCLQGRSVPEAHDPEKNNN